MTFRSLPALAAVIVMAGCQVHVNGSDRFQADFHHVYPMQPGAKISVTTHNGPIEIVGWDRNEAEVSGTKTASSQSLLENLKVDITNSPTSLEIRVVKPGSPLMGGTSARLTLHVPRTALVDRAETSNASIHVRDLAGAAHLRSSNGSVRVENVGGDLEARTSNSSIEVDGVSGEAQLRTSNGRIQVEGVAKAVDAETSNSRIRARLAGTSPVRLISSNGSIDVALTRQLGADVRAETKNSSITVHIPANASARLTADTTNGSVSSDFDVVGSMRGSDDRHRNHLSGVIGSGGPVLDLRTTNGSIRVTRGGDVE